MVLMAKRKNPAAVALGAPRRQSTAHQTHGRTEGGRCPKGRGCAVEEQGGIEAGRAGRSGPQGERLAMSVYKPKYRDKNTGKLVESGRVLV